MLRPLRFRRIWLGLGLALVGGTLVVCLVPTVPGPDFPGGDKVQHLLAYMVLTAWFASLVERRGYPWVALAMIGLGVGIEVAQEWMALGRHGEWRDVLANSLGVAVGLGAAALSRESWFARIERWLPAT